MTNTNNTTQRIIDYLNREKTYEAWRNNNLAVKGRTFIGKRGVPDIIGFRKYDAVWLAIEVKDGNDKLSLDQYKFLNTIHNSGGFACVAKSFDHFLNQFNNHPDDFKQFLSKKDQKTLK